MEEKNIEFEINNYTLTYDSSIESYVNFSEEINDKGKEILEDITEEYNELGNIDAVHNEFYDIGVNALTKVADYIVQILAEYEIYDISADNFLNSTDFQKSALDVWKEYFNKVDSLLSNIIYEANTEKGMRELNKMMRPQFIGGGFGISGAIKGAVKASAINMVTGAAYDIANSISNMATNAKTDEKKEALYKDKHTLYTLKCGIAIAINIIKEEFFIVANIHPFSDNNITKSQNIIKNIEKGNIREDNIENALIEALQLNPLNGDIYRSYLEKLGDQTNELEDMAEFFNLEDYVHNCKYDILLTKLGYEFYLDGNNPEHATNLKAVKEFGSIVNDIRDVLKNQCNAICAFDELEIEDIKAQYIYTVNLSEHLGLINTENISDSNDHIIGMAIKSISDLLFNLENPNNQIPEIALRYGEENGIIMPYRYFADESISEFQIDAKYQVVGNGAFARCINLNSIKFNEGLTEIGEAAFAYTGVRSIELPSTLQTIKREAFANCEQLEKIYVPDSVTTIESGAFENCFSLKEVRLPNNLLYIGKKIFGKKSVDLICHPNSSTAEYFKDDFSIHLDGVLTHKIGGSVSGAYVIKEDYQWIQNRAFAENDELKEVTIPSTIKEIGVEAFANCTSLKKVLFVPGVEKINKYAFAGCTSLKKIEIPSTVKEICAGAFFACENLDELLVIPEGVERLADDFTSTSGVTKILLPKSLKEIYFDTSEYDENDIPDYEALNFKDIEFICAEGSYAYNYCQEHNLKIISDSRVFEHEQDKAISRQESVSSDAKQNVEDASGNLLTRGNAVGCLIWIVIIIALLKWLF